MGVITCCVCVEKHTNTHHKNRDAIESPHPKAAVPLACPPDSFRDIYRESDIFIKL